MAIFNSPPPIKCSNSDHIELFFLSIISHESIRFAVRTQQGWKRHGSTLCTEELRLPREKVSI